MKALKKIGLLCAIALLPITAQADSGWYGGGAFGLSRNNFNSDNTFNNTSLCLTAAYTCTANAGGGAIEAFVGKDIGSGFAVEGGLLYLNNTMSLDYTQPFSTGTFRQSTTALKLSLVKNFDLGSGGITGFGKLGAALWSSRLAYDRTPNSATFFDRTENQTGISPVLGLGVEMKTGANSSLRIGWDHYFGMGRKTSPFHVINNTISTAKTDIDVLYVGLKIRF